jgi:DNA-binding beta-propeller fold protein YncE
MYVGGNNYISIINCSNNSFVNDVLSGRVGLVKTIRYNSVDNSMYFIIGTECITLNCSTNSIVGIPFYSGSNPLWLEFKSNTNKLYSSDYAGNAILILDPTIFGVSSTILTPGSEPSYSKVLGNLLFVSAPTTNQMLVINTTTNTITNTVNVNSPSGIAIYNGNGVLYIGDNSNNNINVISDSAFNVIETITNANSPLVLELANNFTTRKLYFSNQTSLSTNIGIICLPLPS